jgi:hypothetical protein
MKKRTKTPRPRPDVTIAEEVYAALNKEAARAPEAATRALVLVCAIETDSLGELLGDVLARGLKSLLSNGDTDVATSTAKKKPSPARAAAAQKGAR